MARLPCTTKLSRQWLGYLVLLNYLGYGKACTNKLGKSRKDHDDTVFYITIRVHTFIQIQQGVL